MAPKRKIHALWTKDRGYLFTDWCAAEQARNRKGGMLLSFKHTERARAMNHASGKNSQSLYHLGEVPVTIMFSEDDEEDLVECSPTPQRHALQSPDTPSSGPPRRKRTLCIEAAYGSPSRHADSSHSDSPMPKRSRGAQASISRNQGIRDKLARMEHGGHLSKNMLAKMSALLTCGDDESEESGEEDRDTPIAEVGDPKDLAVEESVGGDSDVRVLKEVGQVFPSFAPIKKEPIGDGAAATGAQAEGEGKEGPIEDSEVTFTATP